MIVSAAEGWEFADLGGRHHSGGGSHGSLLAGDSTVPMLAAGFDGSPLPRDASVTDLAPARARPFRGAAAALHAGARLGRCLISPMSGG